MLSVLRRAESVFMIWTLPASIFCERIRGQSGKRVPAAESPLTEMDPFPKRPLSHGTRRGFVT